MSYLKEQQLGHRMWAIMHVPSGSWHRGDTELKLYHAEYRALRDCPNDAFKPVPVTVRNTVEATRAIRKLHPGRW